MKTSASRTFLCPSNPLHSLEKKHKIEQKSFHCAYGISIVKHSIVKILNKKNRLKTATTENSIKNNLFLIINSEIVMDIGTIEEQRRRES